MLTDSPGDRGVYLSPLWSWSTEQSVGIEVGVGERPQHTGAPVKPNRISSGQTLSLLVHTVPRGVAKAILLSTHQPWLGSLGEGHFIHKNASLNV